MFLVSRKKERFIHLFADADKRQTMGRHAQGQERQALVGPVELQKRCDHPDCLCRDDLDFPEKEMSETSRYG
jgi:hypothetical protein